MAAMRAEDLYKFLIKMMPLKDITGQRKSGEPVRRTARLSSGDDLLEALVFEAMDELESLVLDGLKIQMSPPATEPAATVAADRRRDEAVGKGCMVHVVLVQVRDPSEWYAAIGDPMIGLIEASLQRKDGAVKQEMQGAARCRDQLHQQEAKRWQVHVVECFSETVQEITRRRRRRRSRWRRLPVHLCSESEPCVPTIEIRLSSSRGAPSSSRGARGGAGGV